MNQEQLNQAMIESIRGNKVSAFEGYMDMGADIDYRDEDGRTVVVRCLIGGWHLVLKSAMGYKPNVMIKDNAQLTYLHYIAHTSHHELLDYPEILQIPINSENVNRMTPLENAVRKYLDDMKKPGGWEFRSKETIERFLVAGASPRYVDSSGADVYTKLERCCLEFSEEASAFLRSAEMEILGKAA